MQTAHGSTQRALHAAEERVPPKNGSERSDAGGL